MKHEFKWYLTLSMDGVSFEKAKRSLALAQDAFFDSLTADDVEWEVVDEENK
jgi:hypothetical protein